MSDDFRSHPLTGALGLFAFALWSVCVLYAAVQYPDVLPSVLIGAFFGLAACLAIAFHFGYWRYAVLLASCVYLLIYVIQVVRMTAIRPDLPFFSALVFYYQTSWRVALGAFQEKGGRGGIVSSLSGICDAAFGDRPLGRHRESHSSSACRWAKRLTRRNRTGEDTGHV